MSSAGEIPGAGDGSSYEDPYQESAPAYYEALQAFEQKRGELHAWAGEFALAQRFDSYEDVIGEKVQDLSQTFGNLGVSIYGALGSVDQSKKILADIIRSDDIFRVNLLNNLSKCDSFECYDDETIDALLDRAFSLAGTVDELGSRLEEEYLATAYTEYYTFCRIVGATQDEGAVSDLENRQTLLDILESFAATYSEDYGDGLEDGCDAAKGRTELGGTLWTGNYFAARRIRSVQPAESYSGLEERLAYEYVVKGTVKKQQLLFETIPKYLIDLATEVGDYEPDELGGDSHFAIGFAQTFTLKSEGLTFDRTYGLTLYINDDKVELEPSDIDDLMEELVHGEVEAEVGEPSVPDGLENIFTEQELKGYRKQIESALYDKDARVALDWLLSNMTAVRFASTPEQYEMAGRIVEQMFTGDEDDA